MRRKSSGFLLLAFSLILAHVSFAPSALALFVTSISADSGGLCTQTVDNQTSVVVNRFANECVVSFNRVGTTNWTVPSGISRIAVLIIAGGGGGGFDVSGGGGAGGLLYYGSESPKTPNGESLTVSSGNVSIVVGDGGAGATSLSTPFGSAATGRGGTGSDSSITLPSLVQYKAFGGGGGNSRNNTATAQSGGSGGGGAYGAGTPTNAGSGTGSGVTLQGFSGGKLVNGSGAGGGGGGAGGSGIDWSDANRTYDGSGGIGLRYLISGSATYYAGGGGAGSWNNIGGPGGLGGGGAGGSIDTSNCRANCGTNYSAQTGNSGAANTGGGGGGSGKADSSAPGGAGGSGVVIIRYALNVSSSANISVPGGAFIFNTAKNITVSTNTPGLVDFRVNGKIIPKCRNVVASNANGLNAVCAYKPAIHGPVVISIYFKPSDTTFLTSSNASNTFYVSARSGNR